MQLLLVGSSFYLKTELVGDEASSSVLMRSVTLWTTFESCCNWVCLPLSTCDIMRPEWGQGHFRRNNPDGRRNSISAKLGCNLSINTAVLQTTPEQRRRQLQTHSQRHSPDSIQECRHHQRKAWAADTEFGAARVRQHARHEVEYALHGALRLRLRRAALVRVALLTCSRIEKERR